MNNTLDDIQYEGTGLQEFVKYAKEFDDCTKIIEVCLYDTKILSYFKRTADSLIVRVIDGDYTLTEKGSRVYSQLMRIGTQKLNQEEILTVYENCKKKESIFAIPEKGKEKFDYYFLGDTAYKTLAACQSGLGGSFLKKPCFERDLALHNVLTDGTLNPKYNLLVRTEGKLNKIMAFYRKKDNRIPFSSLANIMQMREKANVVKWSINQRCTELRFEFLDFKDSPEIRRLQEECGFKLVPQIVLRTSDTCYSAPVVLAVWQYEEKNNHYFIQKEYPLEELSNNTISYGRIMDDQFNFLKRFCIKCKESNNPVKDFSLTKMIGTKTSRKIETSLMNQDKNYVIKYLLDDINFVLSDYQKTQYEMALQYFVA